VAAEGGGQAGDGRGQEGRPADLRRRREEPGRGEEVLLGAEPDVLDDDPLLRREEVATGGSRCRSARRTYLLAGGAPRGSSGTAERRRPVRLEIRPCRTPEASCTWLSEPSSCWGPRLR